MTAKRPTTTPELLEAYKDQLKAHTVVAIRASRPHFTRAGLAQMVREIGEQRVREVVDKALGVDDSFGELELMRGGRGRGRLQELLDDKLEAVLLTIDAEFEALWKKRGSALLQETRREYAERFEHYVRNGADEAARRNAEKAVAALVAEVEGSDD